MITVNNVKKIFEGNIVAIDNVSFHIPKNQVDHRQEELCLWLKNFFDFEILEGSPIKIKINRILKEYEPIPRKYDSSKRKEQAKIRKEEKEMQEHASGTFPLSVLDLMGLYKERGNDFRDLQTIENMEVLIIINPKSIKKGSSLSKGQGSLRQKKADVSITVN